MTAFSTLLTASGLIPALLIVLLALGSARLFVSKKQIPMNHEFASVDGLRGFLAIGVFIHHAIFWISFAKNQNWTFTMGRLYYNLGRNSVNLFFMLTGFLFTLKLLEARSRELDWIKVYSSRLMRLTPLYFCVCLLMFVMLAINSHFVARESIEALVIEARDWLLFTIPGRPDINAEPNSQIFMAGVIWTLPYEWYFYLTLPLLGLIMGIRQRTNSGIWLTIAALAIVTYSSWHLDYMLLFNFLGGAIAATAVRSPVTRSTLIGRGANLVVIGCLVVSYACFDTLTLSNLLILTLALSVIACGADVFGLLTSRAARGLSTISYGIYLLHGVVIYVFMSYVMPGDVRSSLTLTQHWLYIFMLTPILVLVASLSWRFIEAPAIRAAPRLAVWIRNVHKRDESSNSLPKDASNP